MHIILKTLLMAMVALKTVSAEGSASGTVQKLNLFSSSLFHAVAKGNPGQTNLITSPFTTGVTLAMAACGAQGQTLSQFKTMFNILPRDKIDMPGYQVIIDDLNNIRQNKLALTNKMFTAKHFIVNGDYKDLTDNYFRSVAQAVDFTQPEIAGNTINTWVRRNTNNLINNIIPDDLDKQTKLVLVDAVYFKGQWEKKFNSQFTQDLAFNVDNNTVRYVPTMYRQGTYQYGEHADLHAKFIVIPYKANELSLVIIIPNEIEGLEQLEGKLQNMRLTEFLNQGQDTPLKLYLPKFRVEEQLDVTPALQKLGLIDAFTESADFSGIASGHLHISKVLQKVIIEVDEQGTEVPGVGHTDQTGRLVPGRRSLLESPIDLSLNHPFIYSIIRTGDFDLELLRGRIIDPESD